MIQHAPTRQVVSTGPRSIAPHRFSDSAPSASYMRTYKSSNADYFRLDNPREPLKVSALEEPCAFFDNLSKEATNPTWICTQHCPFDPDVFNQEMNVFMRLNGPKDCTGLPIMTSKDYSEDPLESRQCHDVHFQDDYWVLFWLASYESRQQLGLDEQSQYDVGEGHQDEEIQVYQHFQYEPQFQAYYSEKALQWV